jgi:hypothetical protein
MDAIEKYLHAGVTVSLLYDTDAEYPRKRRDSFGTLVSFTPEFDGDETMSSDMEIECKHCDGSGRIEVGVREYVIAEADDVALVIGLRYDGAGLYVDNSDPNAALYCTRATITEEFKGNVEGARRLLEAQVEEIDAWLSGKCYGYALTDENDEELPFAFQDSCWGFIGDLSSVKRQAEEAAKWAAKMLAREAQESADMAARGIMTVGA